MALEVMSPSTNGVTPYTTQVVDITPAMAEAFLSYNEGNRNLDKNLVMRYAGEMARGEWVMNFEPIIIADTGRLLDGQHRLAACIEAGVPFKSLVARNAPESVFTSLGMGKGRTFADILTIQGRSNATSLQAATALAWHLIKGTAPSVRNTASNPGMLAFLQSNPGIEVSLVRYLNTRKPLSASILAAFHYVCSLKDPALADFFFDRLVDGAGLATNDPIYVLRERLLDNAANKAKLPRRYIQAITIKAWNFSRKGVSIRLIRWMDGEPFPEIE